MNDWLRIASITSVIFGFMRRLSTPRQPSCWTQRQVLL